MHAIRVSWAVAFLFVFTEMVAAQQEFLDEPRSVEQIKFSTPTRASVRLTSGVRRTGRVVSISREKLVLQLGRGNREVEIPIDEVQRVNTLDNEFTYEPANEDFERLKVKARRISYLSVQVVKTYDPPAEGVADPPVNETPQPAAPAENPETNTNPETRPEMRPGSLPGSEGQPVAPGSESPTTTSPPSEPQPGDLVLFCSFCQGVLPPSIHNGDKCPHCGMVLWNARPPAPAASGSPTAPTSGGSTAPDAAAYPTAPGAPQNSGGAAVASAPAQPGNGGGNVVARGTSLADLPTWMKVGFFVGMLAVCWLILQRR